MLNFPDIKLGKVVNFNNSPCVIIKCDFLRMQQRKPVKKCTLKNLVTGSNIDYSFKSGESIEEADLARKQATFTYQSEDILNFMLSEDYESIELPAKLLGDKIGYLKDGLEVIVVYFNNEPISVELPVKVSFLITDTMDIDKGNSVQGVLKEATIETGKVIRVPAFIKKGDKVLINTIEDEYTERDTSK